MATAAKTEPEVKEREAKTDGRTVGARKNKGKSKPSRQPSVESVVTASSRGSDRRGSSSGSSDSSDSSDSSSDSDESRGPKADKTKALRISVTTPYDGRRGASKHIHHRSKSGHKQKKKKKKKSRSDSDDEKAPPRHVRKVSAAPSMAADDEASEELERAIHTRLVLEKELLKYQLNNEQLLKAKEQMEEESLRIQQEAGEEVDRTRHEALSAAADFESKLQAKEAAIKQLEEDLYKLRNRAAQQHEEEAEEIGRLDPKSNVMMFVPKDVKPVHAVLRAENPSSVYMTLDPELLKRIEVHLPAAAAVSASQGKQLPEESDSLHMSDNGEISDGSESGDDNTANTKAVQSATRPSAGARESTNILSVESKNAVEEPSDMRANRTAADMVSQRVDEAAKAAMDRKRARREQALAKLKAEDESKMEKQYELKSNSKPRTFQQKQEANVRSARMQALAEK